ncbi:MAG: F0F1 ATP synthase subunit epsilon, partial [Planctomycetes bacterium]|nr:F0F1 ATP synthase subunit epsilon [Planctomycetota bacterium]
REAGAQVDLLRAELALRRALVRLRAASGSHP